jgi:hypothetical protein
VATSRLQEPFLREWAATFIATEARLRRRLAEVGVDEPAVPAIVRDELRGLFHGLLVTFDGGSGLAGKGLVHIVDDDGVAFDRFLHEICRGYWPRKQE